MAQFARPNGDANFPASFHGTPVNSAGNRYQNIDESSQSDSDYNYCDNNPGGSDQARHTLSTVTDPAVSTGHIVRFAYVRTNAGVPSGSGTAVNLTVVLMQENGGSPITIASKAITNITSGSWIADSFTLTGTEADSISDYSDLAIRFDPSGGGGSPSNRRGVGYSWAEFEVPDAASFSDIALNVATSITQAEAVDGIGSIAQSLPLSISAILAAEGTANIAIDATLDLTQSQSVQGLIDSGLVANISISQSQGIQGMIDGALSVPIAIQYNEAIDAIGTLALAPNIAVTKSLLIEGVANIAQAVTISGGLALSLEAFGDIGAALDLDVTSLISVDGFANLSLDGTLVIDQSAVIDGIGDIGMTGAIEITTTIAVIDGGSMFSDIALSVPITIVETLTAEGIANLQMPVSVQIQQALSLAAWANVSLATPSEVNWQTAVLAYAQAALDANIGISQTIDVEGILPFVDGNLAVAIAITSAWNGVAFGDIAASWPVEINTTIQAVGPELALAVELVSITASWGVVGDRQRPKPRRREVFREIKPGEYRPRRISGHTHHKGTPLTIFQQFQKRK